MSAPVKVAVVGPTASGKSELALALAQKLRGEVVNADSMQVYRGMNIGTAKLSHTQRLDVPHHLLDIWPVTKAASLAEYQQMALAVVNHLTESAVTPLLVGGSGMYVQAVVDEWEIPGTDAEVRARLESELKERGVDSLYQRLRVVDPEAAAAILPSNERRIVRALEVVELQGSFSATLPTPRLAESWVLVGLDVPRPVLDQRIERRVHRMWEQGLVAEVRDLVDQGLREGVTASRALGYAQVLQFLQGQTSEEQAREQTVVATRRFARRQLSWFRRDPRIQWLTAPSESPGSETVKAALGAIESITA